MLISVSTRAFHSASLHSFGTFFKHLPTIKPPTLNLRHFTTGDTVISRASAPVSTSAASAVGTPYFETLTSHQKHQVRLYIDSLLQWNQKMNLTAVKDENEVMERHVEDSLTIIEPVRDSYMLHCGISFENLSVVDVGSGAGLPGMILAIACPGWKVTLLESMNKRCVFLEHVAGLIGLQNVQIVRDRAENLGQNLNFRESFDIAVARAVAEMRVLAEYCLPLVRVGGLFVAAKGHDPQEEVAKAERAIQLMGASLLQTCFVESHSKHGQRTAIICLKDGPTPRKYPRPPGTPSKLPL
ncbi:S-adenosyl-L-methionine-dependent methyltransferases superfamily protein [Perilla frutescens var. hirtella]|uniref:S-adenosyl-L-methionine-dependent methyltransferases superfamily protein n=1 Tax=Perilla frutescens var. hirtella TaxID=608512 RepID=A0AAD4IQB5_PERFH|nr:S-adenosyl-L-methionine-dependent methyltransferases superfamily protein [Perilla frutescens var. hirtella]KAH6797405.1 S-adenosyl-L-methionine-dependent methyltransferases superfamily protein [Perilla frutescens var. hirtella]KAH6807603.1 S-adenosyl-L-methionine-dependent methyltransferases superfamily protein [Perilla frutescens var. frutescens]